MLGTGIKIIQMGIKIRIERLNKPILLFRNLSWAAVILWMALIFYLSHQPATDSNELYWNNCK